MMSSRNNNNNSGNVAFSQNQFQNQQRYIEEFNDASLLNTFSLNYTEYNNTSDPLKQQLDKNYAIEAQQRSQNPKNNGFYNPNFVVQTQLGPCHGSRNVNLAVSVSAASQNKTLKSTADGRKILDDSFIYEDPGMGRFKKLEKVGKGTYGVVHKALDSRTNRYVAIKGNKFCFIQTFLKISFLNISIWINCHEVHRNWFEIFSSHKFINLSSCQI